MDIFYCDKCKKRVLGDDVAKGRAAKIAENNWLCEDCKRQMQAPVARHAAPPGAAIVALKGARTATARISRSAAAAPQKKSILNLIMLCSATGILLLIGVFMARGTGKNSATADPRAILSAPTKPLNLETSTAEKVARNTSLPSPPSTVEPIATLAPLSMAERARQSDKVMEEFRNQRAAKLLEEHQAWFKQNPLEVWQFQLKLREFADSYRSTPAAAEAGRILDELKLSPSTVGGRFVRVELRGKNRILSLSEVQIFSEGRNVAVGGKATQSSLEYGGVPNRAIDGNTDGNFFANSTTSTALNGEDVAWWEVDLGDEKKLEGLVIWNRTDCCQDRLKDFKISVLDKDRTEVWNTTVAIIPMPKAAFSLTPMTIKKE